MRAPAAADAQALLVRRRAYAAFVSLEAMIDAFERVRSSVVFRRTLAVGCVLIVSVAAVGSASGKRTSSTGLATAVHGPAGVFVGRVAGSKAYLAVVTDGRRVAGYVCDGKKVSVWLRGGKLVNGSATLTTRRGARLGSVKVTGDRADGELEVGSKTRRFHASTATGSAGLYRAQARSGDRQYEAGWIVLPDRSQRGATNITDGTSNTVVTHAPRLDPAASTVTLGAAGTAAIQKLRPGIIAILIG